MPPEQCSPAISPFEPSAPVPAHCMLEYDRDAWQEPATESALLCHPILKHTALINNAGHAQVPVQFTVDTFYDAALQAEVTATADKGAQCGKLLSPYLSQLVRAAAPNPEVALISPGARLLTCHL